jgi:hypothetical protein
MVVAFGVGLGVGNQWVSLSFGPKAAVVASGIDSSVLRPIVRDEVQKGVADALANQKEAAISGAPTTTAADPSPPSLPSRAAALVSLLHTVRAQLALYRLQHNDRNPTFAQLQNKWAALTQATNSDGTLAGGTVHVFGPYMQSAPVNPLTNRSALSPAGLPNNQCGWTYDERTGRVKAFVPMGHPGGELLADAYVERGTPRRVITASADR